MASESEDIRTLMLQIQAGMLLLEEIMDEEVGGDWVKPGGRGSGVAGRNAWGQLSIAWINLGSMLLRDPSIEAWTIPPLVSRSSKGEQHSIEFDRDGHLDISAFEGSTLELRDVPADVVRIIHEPKEPRYTLEEAKALLEVCQQHQWVADVGEDGRPIGVKCSTEGCGERRPLR